MGRREVSIPGKRLQNMKNSLTDPHPQLPSIVLMVIAE